MSSQNPGISAAGKAAGRTALNPAAGPAAIGGMLQAGEEPSDDLSGVDFANMQSRLAKAVSDIAKLANAMEALVVDVVPEMDEASGGDVRLPEIGSYQRGNEHRQEAS
jgi:hypothetical protein